ncbi:hypothetical protein [Canibacter oris]|uniref:Uncharacterized protein n=1 Tax=Canibacter oris TaxID=1365628 RepID=A0A840DDT4_9MICO|nr:hypothetical protein [Canibacter oris]MBB4071611.1 hypothetical protein [Canibacter oris]
MSEVFRVCGCETLNELCLPCRRRLSWRLVDLEFRYQVLVASRVPSSNHGEVGGSQLVSGGCPPVSVVLLDALKSVEELILGWGVWVRNKLRLPQNPGLTVPAVFDLLHDRFDTLTGVFETHQLLRDFEQTCIELERLFPVDAAKSYQRRHCPLCTRDEVVCRWPAGHAPEVSCTGCGWFFEVDWSEFYAPDRFAYRGDTV